jgi:23S rRNA (adenine2503-C2)-methyltransferase
MKKSLIGLSREELSGVLETLGVPFKQHKMRIAQLWQSMYVQGATDFVHFTTIGKELRASLEAQFSLARPQVVTEQVSIDGTRKWLLKIAPTYEGEKEHEVEMVYIPTNERGTLCISSQVGCTLSCTFCHTGTQKLVRNLTPSEIVGQVMVARDRLGEWPNTARPQGVFIPEGDGRALSNIVLMGMGEPLYNYENVRQAMDIVCDGDGIAIGRRRITLSTSGVVPFIERAGEEMGVMLAISLHATNDELRDKLVPLNKKYNIAMLLEACRNYPGLNNARRITFEYVMLKGVNDSAKEAKELVRLLRGIPAKINLIPFNPWPNSNYECSEWEQIEAFSDILFEAGYASPVRTPRGRDILAACGQLKSETEIIRASEREALRAMMMVE